MTVLSALNLQSINPGACYGPDGWLLSPSKNPLASINPATETILAEVNRCSDADYETVIAQAESAFLTWREVPAPKRGEIVRQIAEQLRKQKNVLGELVALETGKLIQEARGEVQEMIDMADFAVGQSRMLYGKTMPSERPLHRLQEQWLPLGVVGVITAFNFPVAVWAWNAFIAAICGNTVVWKPSSQTPLSAIAVQHMCNHVIQQNQCPNVFSLFLPEERATLDRFIDDHRVSLISFTGSTETGRRVGVRVAQRLGKSLLELSGNNAVIVEKTANVDLAVNAVLFGAVGTSGQRCTSTRRLFLDQDIYNAFVYKLVKAYQQIRIGNPLDTEMLMGPLINQKAVDAYQSAIAEIQKTGGEIIYGGEVLSGPGYFVEPALVKIHPDAAIVHRETFAPILYIMSFETFEEALKWQNAASHGLASALFTNNMQCMEQFLSAAGSDCGMANINIGTSGAEIGGAFGGQKNSGGGREAGSDAWKAYMRRQTATINWSNELPLAQGIEFHLT